MWLAKQAHLTLLLQMISLYRTRIWKPYLMISNVIVVCGERWWDQWLGATRRVGCAILRTMMVVNTERGGCIKMLKYFILFSAFSLVVVLQLLILYFLFLASSKWLALVMNSNQIFPSLLIFRIGKQVICVLAV